MNIKFLKEHELKQLLVTNDIHIIKDLLKSDFYVELKKANIDNPDIGLEENGFIILADPRNRRIFIVTKVHYTEYKD